MKRLFILPLVTSVVPGVVEMTSMQTTGSQMFKNVLLCLLPPLWCPVWGGSITCRRVVLTCSLYSRV